MSWRLRASLILILLASLFGTTPSFAQSVPVVTGVFPPGATVGQEMDWTFSGRNLAKVRSLVIAGQGVEVVGFSSQGENSVTAKVRVAVDAEPGFRDLRLDGPSGVSNLVVVRIDRLKQVLEVEPNDELAECQTLEPGTAVAGVLKSLDLDHFRVKGTAGQKLTIDLEAQRLGTSIEPIVTIFSSDGTALAQGRRSRGQDQDCRISVVLPADGIGVVQLRDNTYGGNDQARYRLRFDTLPFATALFPLGGTKGQTLDLEVSGGNLAEPLRKTITLPDTPGLVIKPGLIDGPGGPIAIPGAIVVGDGPEIVEPRDRAEGSSIEVKPGLVVNGRIGKPAEVDSYTLAAKTGDKFRVRIEARALGSWIDSVIAIRDAQGMTLEESDDSERLVRANVAGSITPIGLPQGSPDSMIEFETKQDGPLTIEVTDRFGEGGPEYSYRLVISQDRTDLAVTLLLGNNTGNAAAVNALGQLRTIRTSPGQFGVFNLKPGGSVPINFMITPEGRPGMVEVTVEGLPDGATAEPVLIRFPGLKSPPNARADPVADFILVKVDSFAQPGLSELRVVAKAKPSPGVVLTREALGVIGIDLADVTDRPIVRLVNQVPLRIIGESKPRFIGPPAPPKLVKVSGPKDLLLGDQVDLKLEFVGIVTADDGSTVEIKADGMGLSAGPVTSSGIAMTDDERGATMTIHLVASIKADLGMHPVTVTFAPPGGLLTTQELTVEVKIPIEVRPQGETIFLRPGDQATLPVAIRREAGFDGEVEIRLEGLPEGVSPPKVLELGPGQSKLDVRLEMDSKAKPIEKPVELRVVGMARMPRGNVSVESKIRPMIEARPADK